MDYLREEMGCPHPHHKEVSFSSGHRHNHTRCVTYLGQGEGRCSSNMTYCLSDAGHRWYGSSYDVPKVCSFRPVTSYIPSEGSSPTNTAVRFSLSSHGISGAFCLTVDVRRGGWLLIAVPILARSCYAGLPMGGLRAGGLHVGG